MADPAAKATQVSTETNGPVVLTVGCVFGSLSLIFTALRLYTRSTLLKAIGKDDWAVLVATCFLLINCVAMGMEVKYGMGKHQEALSLTDPLNQLKFLLVSIISYNLGMNSVKLGFLFQYKRIFQDRLVQKICFWGIVYVCLWAIAQALILGFATLPTGILYPELANRTLDTLTIWYLSSGMSMATDIAIFCIPLPSVWKLQLPLKQRIMVIGIFCLGFFVCIVSIYRMFTLHSAVNSLDPSWENIGAAIWSCVELSVSIIASNLPTLRPLLARMLPGLGLSRATKDRSAYLRYGGSTLASPRTGNYSKSASANRSANRGTRANSISTEELALKEMAPGGTIAAGMYANATADNHGHGFSSTEKQQQNNVGRIVMTTEISVSSGSR